MRYTHALIIAAVFGVGAGCAYHVDKFDPNAPMAGAIPPSEASRIGFDQVQSKVITPYCMPCHGAKADGDVDLRDYAHVRRDLNRIRQDIVSRKMPRNRAMPDTDREYLRAWIDAGAPEVGSSEPAQPEPQPQPSPTTQPSAAPSPVPSQGCASLPFSKIQARVFMNYCMPCHNEVKHKADVILSTTYERVKNDLRDVRDDVVVDGSMPPRGHPMPDSERECLKEWIDAGAPESDGPPQPATESGSGIAPESAGEFEGR